MGIECLLDISQTPYRLSLRAMYTRIQKTGLSVLRNLHMDSPHSYCATFINGERARIFRSSDIQAAKSLVVMATHTIAEGNSLSSQHQNSRIVTVT
jgi:hypothetical protein